MSSRNLLEPFEPLLNKKVFAHLSTIMPNGSPQVSPVWLSFDSGLIWINTAVGRQKDRNMKRDPRVALSILDPDNPYFRLLVRGEVTEWTIEGAVAHINALAKKYMGTPKYQNLSPSEQRIIYKIKPHKVTGS
ncbi:MAG: PPOX class F420-dependent oxidoreductase [Candidatus Thorarchaeota archaeon]